MVEEGVVED